MKIYVSNAEEYVGAYLGICGEAELGHILARAPFSEGNTYRAIKSLKDARVLLRHRYDDGRKFLRLSSVGGAAYLDSISPALSANARITVRGDLKYSGSKPVRKRERMNYELYSAMLDKGIPVNEIEFEYRQPELFRKAEDNTEGESIFREDGSPFTFENISAGLRPDHTGIFTKRVIKERKEEGEISHKGSRTSRISGTLFLKGQVYQMYALSDPYSSAWKTEAEFNAANYISGTIENESSYHRAHGIHIDNRCILTFPSAEYAERMIVQEPGKSVQIDPCQIYNASYVSPSYSIDDSVVRLLGTPNWEAKIIDMLFPGGRHDGLADVTTDDGTEVYNFIASDLNRIRSAMPRVLNIDEPMVLLIEAWMADAIHRIFNRDNIEIVEISSEELSVLASNIG